MPATSKKVHHTLPLSFRVPAEQIEEIDREVARDHRKERVSLLEPIWNWAWAAYRRVGSVRTLIEDTAVVVFSKRVSRETQQHLFTALETIVDRAPSTVVEEVTRILTSRAGKYGDEKT
jgi:hypothetical protein